MVEVELKDIIQPGTIRGLDFVILDELRNGCNLRIWAGAFSLSYIRFSCVKIRS